MACADLLLSQGKTNERLFIMVERIRTAKILVAKIMVAKILLAQISMAKTKTASEYS